MFVMLSVHTNSTVRERHADTVNQKVNNCNNSNTNNHTHTDKIKKFINENNNNTDNNNKVTEKTTIYNFQQSNTNNTAVINGINSGISSSSGAHNNVNNKRTELNGYFNCRSFELKNEKNHLLNLSGYKSLDNLLIKASTSTTRLASIGQGASILLSPDSLQTTTPAPRFLQLTGLNNNFEKLPIKQTQVATILNNLNTIPAPVKVKNIYLKNYPMSPMTPTGLPNHTPEIKAMRYYRLWIYTCNAVLLMAVIIFCGVAGKVLIADYRRLLVNGLNLTQPSFIYAYLALLVQSGFLQLVGCLGALRLSEKLLNAYWMLLLLLLLGDAILGIFWIFKFDRIMQDLQPALRSRLLEEYGNKMEFTELWDRFQAENRCCGVTSDRDYYHVNRTYPTSCCALQNILEPTSISRKPMASAVVYRNDELNIFNIKDQHNRNLTDIAETAMNHVISRGSSRGGSDSSSSASQLTESSRTAAVCRAVHTQGCIDKLLAWLRSTADILFVFGYCVIAFLKISFLGILRYEIKEMIQKIKLLHTEMAAAMLAHDECIVSEELQTQVHLANPMSVNGGLQYGEPKVGNRDRDRNRIDSLESERESLLVHEKDNTPRLGKLQQSRQLYKCINQEPGESDTNSNCALIFDEITHHPQQLQLQQQQQQQHSQPQQTSSSCMFDKDSCRSFDQPTRHHPHHQQQLLMMDTASTSASASAQHQSQQQSQQESSSNTAATKTINGNNNYELTEFDNKESTYRETVWGFKVSQELLV